MDCSSLCLKRLFLFYINQHLHEWIDFFKVASLLIAYAIPYQVLLYLLASD